MMALVMRLLAAVVGIWVMFAPAALGYEGLAADNDRIVGPIAVSVALIAMSEVVRALRFVNLAVGAWLAVSAFIFPYPPEGMASALLAGLVLAVLSSRGGDRKKRYGGGWRALGGRADP